MNPGHYAVVVGIDQYVSFTPLEGARNDATDFFDWVTSTEGGGVPPENAALIRKALPPNPTEEDARPTREEIARELEARMKQAESFSGRKWNKTRLYFYVAGHGIAPAERDAALLAANASPKHLGRHVSCSALLDYFDRVQHFREVVIFADCCRTTDSRAIRMPVEWTDDDLDNGGIRKFFGCGAVFRREAFEDMRLSPDERRGYFTTALLDGLKGGAKRDRNNGISTAALREYIEERMKREQGAAGLRHPLEPEFYDEGNGILVFPAPNGTVAPPSHSVILRFKNCSPSEVEIHQPSKSPVKARRTPEGFVCDLPIGFYEAVAVDCEPRPAGQEWLFKVIEGGGKYEF